MIRTSVPVYFRQHTAMPRRSWRRVVSNQATDQNQKVAQLVSSEKTGPTFFLLVGKRYVDFLTASDKLNVTTRGDVVQSVRTLPCHGRGREFESRRPRHFFQSLARMASALVADL